MASAIRRLQTADRNAHGQPAAATPQVASAAPAVAQHDDDNPLALLEQMGLETAPVKAHVPSQVVEEEAAGEGQFQSDDAAPDSQAHAVDSGEDEVEEPPAIEESGNDKADSAPAASAPAVPQTEQETVRADVLDILAAMSPVFKAAAIYPGVDGTPAQVEDAIRRMSRASAQLADAVARETDALEIDLRWRRRRATVFTADLVASHWLSAVIRQGGAAFDGLSLNEAMPRLARGVQAALSVVQAQPLHAETGVSPSAAVLSLAPLVLDLQRYADVIQTSLPEFLVEIDAAAAAVGAVAGEEVRLGVGRLAKLVPDHMQAGLASELMAHVGPMALSAWELVRGNVLAQLQGAADAPAGLAILTGPGMTGGVPVAGIVDRLRPMVRRLVGTVEYAAREMLGARGAA